jgi:NADH dehydrogenase
MDDLSRALQRTLTKQLRQEKFRRDSVDLITSARVSAVHPDHVVYTVRSPDGTITTHEIPTNFVLWSTGIAMNPFTRRVSALLPNQVHKKAIEVDAHLRVKGAPLGDVYAIGDCATVRLFMLFPVLGVDFMASRLRRPS